MNISKSTVEDFIVAPPMKESIPTSLLSFNMLEGEYRSFMLGKSDDYEDLREYQIGDSTRDIDWKATARTNEPVIRRYKQEKHHNLTFLIDTGLNMQGMSEDLHPKLFTGLRAAGALMHLALSHRDMIEVIQAYPSHVENTGKTSEKGTLNTSLNNAVSNSSNISSLFQGSSLSHLLNVFNNQSKNRSIVVLVTDMDALSRNKGAIEQLTSRHHVLAITVDDLAHAAENTGETYLDIITLSSIPESLRTDPKVIEEYRKHMEEEEISIGSFMSSIHAKHVSVSKDDEIISKLHELITAEEGRL